MTSTQHDPSDHVAAEVLSALVDGEAAPGEGERARRHVRACPRCRAVYEGLQAVADAFGTAPDPGMPIDPASRERAVHHAVSARDGAWHEKLRSRRVSLVAAAAAVLVIACVVVVGGLPGAPAPRRPLAAAHRPDYSGPDQRAPRCDVTGLSRSILVVPVSSSGDCLVKSGTAISAREVVGLTTARRGGASDVTLNLRPGSSTGLPREPLDGHGPAMRRYVAVVDGRILGSVRATGKRRIEVVVRDERDDRLLEAALGP